MDDKRDECGCHRECTMLPHDCDHKCVWPSCLTEAEHQQLLDELEADDCLAANVNLWAWPRGNTWEEGGIRWP